MLQKELKDGNHVPEAREVKQKGFERFAVQEWINYLLPVCARDASKVYFISPSMRGEQPTIYLAKPPLWFHGFLEDEDKQQVATSSTSSVFGEEIDGKGRKRSEGKASRKPRRDRPLMPGAVDPKEALKKGFHFISI